MATVTVQDKVSGTVLRKATRTTPVGDHFTVQVTGYRSLRIPGVEGASKGSCFIRVTEMPGLLDRYMSINPRVPARGVRGVLQGPVIAGILETLREQPSTMALKNQGIYLLVEAAQFTPTGTGTGNLVLTFTDKGRHGIINGGHTYAAIREAVESAGPEELENLAQAYVQVHVLEGIDPELVPDLAEGLNRSKQVDDPSLMNLQGEFDAVRRVLRGTVAEKNVAYHQGAEGPVYVSELLVYLSMFNVHRFPEDRQPNGLYNRAAMGLRYFKEDLHENKKELKARLELLPDILMLVDTIRKAVPEAARRIGFKYGMGKAGGERLGGYKQKGMELPFLGEHLDYRIPNGWLYPMLAAFRTNLKQDKDGTYTWRVPLGVMLGGIIDGLVAACVSEHKASGGRPELIGKRETAYAVCYTKAELYLSRKRL